jgi:hypothetical protein
MQASLLQAPSAQRTFQTTMTTCLGSGRRGVLTSRHADRGALSCQRPSLGLLVGNFH